MLVRFIGDVHGKYGRYKNLIRNVPCSRQVGDMGVGFYYIDHEGNRLSAPNPPYDTMKREGDHKYIRGNHDNPRICKQQELWIPDGHLETLNNKKIMYVGGALSVDRNLRREGYNYWEDEELSHEDFINYLYSYSTNKPNIMVTHDCPEQVVQHWLQAFNKVKYNDPSYTRYAFDYYITVHKPKYWIFGHWHQAFMKELNGTIFICLGELNYIDLNLETMEITGFIGEHK